MGRYGSGKSFGSVSRPEREKSFTLSSTSLHQEDYLSYNQSVEHPLTMTYTFGNSPKEHTIGVYTSSDEVRLEYTISKDGGKEEEFSYNVPVVWTECHFGGYRPWFRCPTNSCNERVEKIYKPTGENIFACRHCHDITYRRCNISGKPTEIAMYKKRKIAEKLEADDANVSVGAWPPTKPKNMHWDTFEELEEEWRYWDKEHKKRFQNSLRKFNDGIIENLSEII